MSECSAVRNDRPPKSRDVSIVRGETLLPVPPSLKLRRASTQILAPPSLSRNTIAWDCKGAPFARPPFAEATEGKHSNLGTAKLE